jgi:hypothetical protein
MAPKPKSFDCLEMKRQAQEQLLAEYEARKGEFPAYWQFLEAKARESEFWGKFRTTPSRAKPE